MFHWKLIVLFFLFFSINSLLELHSQDRQEENLNIKDGEILIEGTVPTELPANSRTIELNFSNVEIRNLIEIMSKITGKSFLFHEKDLKNRRITLVSPQKYTLEEAYSIFEKILSVNDLSLVQQNKITRVINKNSAKRELTDIITGEETNIGDDRVVTRIIPVRNVNINTIRKGLKPFLSTKGVLNVYAPTNSFIIKDSYENTELIANMIETFDKNPGLYAAKRYNLKYIDIATFKKVIDNLFANNNVIGRKPFYSINKEANSFIILASNSDLKRVEKLIAQLDVEFDNDVYSLEIIKVRYSDLKNIITILKQLLISEKKVEGKGKKKTTVNDSKVKIISLDGSSSFVIYAPKEVVNRVYQYLAKIDIPYTGKVLEIIQIYNAKAAEIGGLVNNIFNALAKNSANKISIFSDARTNSLIMIATEHSLVRIKKFIQRMDVSLSNGVRRLEASVYKVYPLQHATAGNVASILSSLLSNIATTASSRESTDDTKVKKIIETQQKQEGNGISVIAYDSLNALILHAKPGEIKVIEEVIQTIDIPRRQVFVEALIVETTLEKSLSLGVNYKYSDLNNSGAVGTINNPDTDALSVPNTFSGLQPPTGSFLGVLGPTISYGGTQFVSYQAFLRALRTDSEIEILSNPHLLTLSNQKAEIKVGEIRPFTTSVTYDADGNNPKATYDYKEVGISLSLTPQLNESDTIQLEIHQESKQIQNTQVQSNSEVVIPTTLQRTIDTTVIVQDGETIVLGGLISDAKQTTNNAVPCLGDIPLLNIFFKSSSSQRNKTNLLVFITPRIVKTREDTQKRQKRILEKAKTNEEGIFKIKLSDEYNLPDLLNEDEQELKQELEEEKLELEQELEEERLELEEERLELEQERLEEKRLEQIEEEQQ